ncbi:MAG: cytochrome c biogenesis protein ResB [Deltaproteobacteria bacterium]|nr:cytochrome c biogenesis protein ResB [Deltaproteobacteria bacterium]
MDPYINQDPSPGPQTPTEATSGELSSLDKVYEGMWRFFCSLRLTLVNLLMLGAGSVIGMVFDQTKSYAEHKAEWGSGWLGRTYDVLEFYDVFHSWWFAIVVVVLALNLIACSFERLPKIWIDIQNPTKELSDSQLVGIKHLYRQSLNAEQLEKAKGMVSGWFKAAPLTQNDGKSFSFFERHRYARTGVYIVHISLLFVMFGSIFVTYNGVDGMIMIVEDTKGRHVRAKGPGGLNYSLALPFEIKCTDFRLKTFVNGAPMEFESDLEIYDKNAVSNPVVRKTIQVNDPLEYKGFTLYQASYNPIPGDQQVQLDICKFPKTEADLPVYEECKTDARNVHQVAIGDKVLMPDGTAFIPLEITREYRGLGSAVKVQKITKSGETSAFVVFRSYPDFDKDIRRGEYVVGFRGFDQQYATGVQVGKVPAINVVFGGFLFIFVGMFMAFFMSHRRYWMRITPKEDGTFVFEYAGAARRHQYAFEDEFKVKQDELIAAFGKEESKADRAKRLRDERKRAKEAKQKRENTK